MKKTLLALNSLFLLMLIAVPAMAAHPLAGQWKHSEKPAWLNITVVDGVGQMFVIRHDDNDKAQGLLVLKEIKPAPDFENQWVGQMYAASINGFVPAQLKLQTSSRLIIEINGPTTHEILQLNKVK